MNLFLILFGKIFVFLSSFLNLGSGSTWPGHIALSINKNFLKDTLTKRKFKIILVAGTNGKTTTGKLIKEILETNNNKVFHNEAGANLINGVASSIIKNSTFFGNLNFQYAIYEVDENTLPTLLKFFSSDFIICLNLFRDQLDRYGEVNIILDKWRKAFGKLKAKTTLVLNSDDPQIASLGKKSKAKVLYFGVDEMRKTELEHASDSTYCPNCGSKLLYKRVAFSHLGDWMCESCDNKRPIPNLEKLVSYPLPGLYNRYNTNAAVLVSKSLGINQYFITRVLKKFKPAFGRQEKIYINGKTLQIFLSKNPVSFNQSLMTVKGLKGKNILIALNNKIPDGRDVSWIWDVDFERFIDSFKNIFVSGDRTYDMAVRLKYSFKNSHQKLSVFENYKEALKFGLKKINRKEVLYVLPTYSAMLDLRKILTGKSIL
ncbi:MAG: hypothetical protein A3B44_01400 [Candidatus Levybacteria bacterium RIFCSPLOWO2_01_FULL_38_21]|nr:MAG: hypothetical protein A3B44_01400 [Candidatus Levybacteria bacterium RIFCSPLOWO2_01_FULL_38_21]